MQITGESTCDILISVSDDSDEGKARFESELPKMSSSELTSKCMKVKHDDQYELIVSGRVYYLHFMQKIMCLTSLQRHF